MSSPELSDGHIRAVNYEYELLTNQQGRWILKPNLRALDCLGLSHQMCDPASLSSWQHFSSWRALWWSIFDVGLALLCSARVDNVCNALVANVYAYNTPHKSLYKSKYGATYSVRSIAEYGLYASVRFFILYILKGQYAFYKPPIQN